MLQINQIIFINGHIILSRKLLFKFINIIKFNLFILNENIFGYLVLLICNKINFILIYFLIILILYYFFKNIINKTLNKKINEIKNNNYI